MCTQVLVGDITLAAETHAAFHSLWNQFGALPERYDIGRKAILSGAWAEMYPLRPELAESCYSLQPPPCSDMFGGPLKGRLRRVQRRRATRQTAALRARRRFRATGDHLYLHMGAEMVESINTHVQPAL